MTPMLERVARALCVAADMDPDRPSNDERDNGAPLWTTYVEMARAGIEAMRGPGDVVLDALRSFDPYYESAADGWNYIIDAALK